MASDAADWSTDDLAFLSAVQELMIAAPRDGGAFGSWTPIWVVVAGDEVFVRTWHRRDTGWYGPAVGSGRARVLLSGTPVDVEVEPTATARAAAVDAAYVAKYGAAGARTMSTAEAVASTLRLCAAASRNAKTPGEPGVSDL